MAATFTPVTLTDLKKSLKRTFSSMPFKESADRGEIVLDMEITDNVGIRVFTSVGKGREDAAGHGEDAIRVLMWNLHKRRPMKSKALGGKAVAVKRTQGWRDTLRRRVEDVLEEYYDDSEGWEARAVSADRQPGSGPSEAQVGYARSLLRKLNQSEPDWNQLTSQEVSKAINSLKQGRPWNFEEGRPYTDNEMDLDRENYER